MEDVGIFCGNWYIFLRIGKLYQEKSGNPENVTNKICRPTFQTLALVPWGMQRQTDIAFCFMPGVNQD
jgi:hypothetical protein